MTAILKIRRLRENADLPLPAYQSPLSAGLDLRADVPESVNLEAGERRLVPTGIAVEIPAGFEGQVRARSGLALKNGIALVNAPGTIDADYRGEIGVILINLAKEAFVINRGDRIAQLVISPIAQPQIQEVTDLSETQRGAGGFGSTGKK
jgi:dUTP pyrophosphatase